jgi:MoaA/NifB/PqqE/SkfB family radical SAM enzyme
MDTNLNKVLKQILSTEDGKYISHIPKNFLTKEKIENFLLARQEEKEKKLILKSRPYKVMIEPTNSCNLGCPICPTGLKIKSRDKGIIKLEQFKKFIDQIKNKTIELYLQNWGEPTLSKQLPEMISYASSQGLWMNLSTNFSIKYKNNLIEKIIKSGLALLQVDLDGTTQEVYEKYRVKGDLKTVIENLKTAVEWKKKLNIKFPIIRTNMIVQSSNEHQVEEFKTLSKSLGVDKFELNKIQINPAVKDSTKWLPSNTEYMYETYDFAKNNKKVVEPCHWPWAGIVVNWDGGVSACCIIDDKNSDFGNLIDNSLDTIWNNENYISARAEFGDQTKITKNTICNICKNDTHNPKLKRRGNSFAIYQ